MAGRDLSAELFETNAGGRDLSAELFSEVPKRKDEFSAEKMVKESPHLATQAVNIAADTAQAVKDYVISPAGNLLAGVVRGSGSIGSTLLAPWDIAKDAIDGKGLSLESNRQRRADIDSGLQALGADPDSLMYQGGKLASEISGTAGIPGVIGKAAQAVNAAPKVVSALTSGGFALNAPKATTVAGKTADAALRVGGGAVAGGTAATLVNPEDTAAGTAIGAVSYPALKTAAFAGKAARNLAGSVITHTLGMTTGAGSEAIKEAFKAGKNGSSAFMDNMAGKLNMTEVLDEAKAALNQMRIDRGVEYRKGMAGVSADKTVLDMAPVLSEVQKIQSMGSFKGVQINSKSADTVQELTDTVANWAGLNPTEYHTPEGLDALKKAIGDIRDSTQFGSAQRKAADQVYNAVKAQIKAQAPEYEKVMRQYSEATEIIDEIQKAFSLGEKASADTAMRKLQSLMRNNVNTNYGNRLDLMKELEAKGGKDLIPSIAGQALNSWTPRGLMGPTGVGIGAVGALNPSLLTALPMGSPRLVGNMAYRAGQASAAPANGLNSIQQGLLGGSPAIGLPAPPISLLATMPSISLSR